LERRARSPKIRAEDAWRAQVILMLAAGESFTTITATVVCYPDYINRWKQRFGTERLAGLQAKYRGQPAGVRTPAMESRILAKTQKRRPDGSTHWSTRKLAKVLGVSHVLVARVWRRAGMQPHRLEHYMLSDDPNFEEKAADVIGLYLNPPQHAAMFAADEKTAIQALDRLDPVLPLSPGRAERHGFEYYRHGTLSLYAALNTRTGETNGQTVPRHTSPAFVEFLGDIMATPSSRHEIHVIVDNLSAHKTKGVTAFLEDRPRVHLHFTPTYACWLNQVELWFGKIERDLLARGIFTSLPDLVRRIRRYIARYNKDPKPIRWTYNDPTHRITALSADTVHQYNFVRSAVDGSAVRLASSTAGIEDD
jgi:transposase